ncbi:alkylated DNA repair protein [Adhaeribacter aerolatus]|uniref:Alkylated DNA repair protein n=1 Tax=Adhaeribacter aerolatus TaxID=670289 RepID=A0A512B0U3_9BACT|nr:alpha-ketoglutarate-dependent dioxygenase AlkB [Adhaeribacter aerolatus]GEO05581.1 alkylated DNA repair protein [Adhaeribacter aerolatus]
MKTKLALPNAEIYFWPQFFSPRQSNYYLTELTRTVAWRQDKIRMFGKEFLLPRLTAWYGDAGKSYQYSGISMKPLPWLPVLLPLKEVVEAAAGHRFNSVLLNYYRHGQDSMGWHSDDEPELGLNPVIASVSFGQDRRFDLRHRQDKTVPKQSVWLEDGSLLLMQGATQHYWQHQLPKSAKAPGTRLNLTFRTIK